MPRRARSTAPTRKLPFSVHDNVDHPVSLYAATKKANELMAHTYSHLYRPADHGPALLHGLRALGPARTWRCSCSPEDPRGRADRRVQPRQAHARLHLRRRHRRGRDPRARPRSRAAIRPGRDQPRPRPPAPRPTGSTTSATTSRWSLLRYIEVLEAMLGPQGREASCCRCSPATCRPPSPTSSDLQPRIPASRPRPRSRPASAASSTGTATSTSAG